MYFEYCENGDMKSEILKGEKIGEEVVWKVIL